MLWVIKMAKKSKRGKMATLLIIVLIISLVLPVILSNILLARG